MCVIGMIDAAGFDNRESEVLSQRRELMSIKAMVKENACRLESIISVLQMSGADAG